MKIGHIKILCYVVAGVLVLLGAKDVTAYIQAKNVDLHAEVAEDVTAALRNVDRKVPKKTELVSYEDIKRGYHRFDWTGKPPRKVDPTVQEGPKEVPKTRVEELISVQMLRYDTDDPDASVASIIYTTRAGMTPAQVQEGQELRKGDTLLEPHDWAKVARVTVEGVEFEFTEEGRENETVSPDLDTESVIYVTDASGVIRPSIPNRVIPTARNPGVRFKKETWERRPGEFRIGTEDIANIATNYPSIISSEIRHRRHRDPKTGRFDGIEIQSVTRGGFASRHGAQQGDIIRSINGHPVTSVAEAVSFVRQNEDKYTTWEVEVENQGKTRTMTYETPPEN